MRSSAGIELSTLRVDGGASVNNRLMQFQADILGVPVHRPVVSETTALGAAYWRDCMSDTGTAWIKCGKTGNATRRSSRRWIQRNAISVAPAVRGVRRSLGWEQPTETESRLTSTEQLIQVTGLHRLANRRGELFRVFPEFVQVVFGRKQGRRVRCRPRHELVLPSTARPASLNATASMPARTGAEIVRVCEEGFFFTRPGE